ncbi:hypothetical protein GCM10022255_076730 [Dactylosporangium darangshiense]|uniref:DUF4350 domain-containing protein n=1 Tax=Dactylosporangium darangshiense TaxID=579108 RepID=A0ABP8DK48_9ACTN
MRTATPSTAAGTPGGTGATSGAKSTTGPKLIVPKRSRRWLRLVIPPLAVIALVLLGAGFYRFGEPDKTDKDFLSPDSHADIGAADLAGRVRAAGVTILPEQKTSDALVAAYNGNATLLITTPQLVNGFYLRMIKVLPSTTRVVIVEPDAGAIVDGLLPFRAMHRNYATKVTGPGCSYSPAAKAGPAETVRSQYGYFDYSLGRPVQSCYDDSLVVYERGSVTVTVVGSADPFRNDRLDEHGNSALATGLLTGAPKLIWLDLHHREPPPAVVDNSALAGGPGAPPSLRPVQPGETDQDFPVQNPDLRAPRPPNVNAPDPSEAPARDDPPNPLWYAFPKWVYPTTALLIVGVIALAVAMAIRLGGPVVEPLPVAVRSSETALGRGRLYQRARARSEALQILRDAALARLARLLRLDPGVDRRVLVEAVAARSGWPAEAVAHVLFGRGPDNDAELVAAAANVEQLVEAATAEHPDAAAEQDAATGHPANSAGGPPGTTGAPRPPNGTTGATHGPPAPAGAASAVHGMHAVASAQHGAPSAAGAAQGAGGLQGAGGDVGAVHGGEGAAGGGQGVGEAVASPWNDRSASSASPGTTGQSAPGETDEGEPR